MEHNKHKKLKYEKNPNELSDETYSFQTPENIKKPNRIQATEIIFVKYSIWTV